MAGLTVLRNSMRVPSVLSDTRQHSIEVTDSQSNMGNDRRRLDHSDKYKTFRSFLDTMIGRLST